MAVQNRHGEPDKSVTESLLDNVAFQKTVGHFSGTKKRPDLTALLQPFLSFPSRLSIGFFKEMAEIPVGKMNDIVI